MVARPRNQRFLHPRGNPSGVFRLCAQHGRILAGAGVSLNKLMEELGTTALAAHDAETRFEIIRNRVGKTIPKVALRRMSPAFAGSLPYL